MRELNSRMIAFDRTAQTIIGKQGSCIVRAQRRRTQGLFDRVVPPSFSYGNRWEKAYLPCFE